jgi:hypothetical protein
MSICRMPPPTGDPVLDAWANDVTQEINCTIFPLISDVASNGGSSGADGNMTLFLYKRTTTASVPATPTSVTYNYVNVDNTTLTANLGWTAEIPSNSGGIYLWVTFRYVSAKAGSINNANSWDTPTVLAQDGAQGVAGDTGDTGDTGATGDPAPRSTTRKLYRAATSLPSPPTATITWATSALSSVTSGWSETAPTQVASSTTYVYTSYIVFSDATGASTTSTSTGGTSVQSTSFSGLVTFASGDFNVDGNAITTIDGGNISSNTITAAKLNVTDLSAVSANLGSIVVDNSHIGNVIQSSSFSSGSTGWRIDKNGSAEFNGVVISRSLVADAGTYTLGAYTDNSSPLFHVGREQYIETNIAIGSWGGTTSSYMASVSMLGTILATVPNTVSFPTEIRWGVHTEIVPLTRWSGAAKLWLKTSLITTRVHSGSSIQYYWKVYKVT